MNISDDKVNVMNTILDKELAFLKTSISAPALQDHMNSTISQRHESRFGGNDSRYNSHRKQQDLSVTESRFEKSTNDYGTASQNTKMHEDIIELQTKIQSLERQIANSQREPNTAERSNVYSNFPLKNNTVYQRTVRTVEENADRLGRSPLRDDTYSPRDDYLQEGSITPPGNKSEARDYGSKSASAKKKLLTFSENLFSPEKSASKPASKKGSAKKKSKKKEKEAYVSPSIQITKYSIEQSILEAQSKLESTKSASRKMSRASSKKSLSKESPKRGFDESLKEISNYNEVHLLNKKYLDTKRKCEGEREALLKERIKGQELALELENLDAKLMKMQNDIEKFNQIELDYDKLMQSFEKSEYIRNQQKVLLKNLNYELEELRRAKTEEEEDVVESHREVEDRGRLKVTKKKKSKSKPRRNV